MICGVEKKRPGPPSKGPRASCTFWMPPQLKAAGKKRAAELGMTFTDLMGELLARETGVPYQMQEGLPLNKAS